MPSFYRKLKELKILFFIILVTYITEYSGKMLLFTILVTYITEYSGKMLLFIILVTYITEYSGKSENVTFHNLGYLYY